MKKIMMSLLITLSLVSATDYPSSWTKSDIEWVENLKGNMTIDGMIEACNYGYWPEFNTCQATKHWKKFIMYVQAGNKSKGRYERKMLCHYIIEMSDFEASNFIALRDEAGSVTMVPSEFEMFKNKCLKD